MPVEQSSPLQATITIRKRNHVHRQSAIKRASMAPTNKSMHLSLEEIEHSLLSFGLKVAEFDFDERASFKKLSDSTFAEIFLMEASDKKVMKVMPLGQSSSSDLPLASSLESVLHEYRAFLALQSLSKQSRYNVPSMHTGFATLDSFRIVRGEYPSTLVKAWQEHPFNNTIDPGSSFN